MSIKPTTISISGIYLFCCLCGLVHGQATGNEESNLSGRLPSMVSMQVTALGDRIKSDRKAITVYSGQYIDDVGNGASVRMMHQLPDTISIEKQNTVFSFDGNNTRGVVSRKKDEALLEVFVMDSVEGMFASMLQGAAVRYLGGGFRPDPRLPPDYDGPRYDIYEVTDTVRLRSDRITRTKLYYFDSTTGLLHSTRYYDHTVRPALWVETHYSLWGNLDGAVYPIRVDHFVNGKRQFTFIAETIESALSMDTAR
jgi:hypothetical protein